MTTLTSRHRESILQIEKRSSVADVRGFGSVTRGDAGPKSDLDLLVRFGSLATLLTVGFQQALESEFGIKVEVIEEGGLSPFMAEKYFRKPSPCEADGKLLRHILLALQRIEENPSLAKTPLTTTVRPKLRLFATLRLLDKPLKVFLSS